MVYFIMACAVTAWVLAVRDMVADPDWGHVPDEYKEGSTYGTDNEESV